MIINELLANLDLYGIFLSDKILIKNILSRRNLIYNPMDITPTDPIIRRVD
jgi:hypothetical protein